MTIRARAQRGLQLFSRATAPKLSETGAMRPPALDQPALDALPGFYAGGGSVTKLLFGDPGSPDGGGMSLAWARFGANYRLPRHSHSVSCLYYIVSGAARLGNQVLGPGDGFFVPADAPYGYTAGPQGVEVLEFRATSCFDSQIRETSAGWERILEAVRANRDRWGEELAAYR